MTIIKLILNLAAGTICLIYGVNLMSSGLENANSRFIRKYVEKFTKNVFTAFITGTAITALTQSSTAVTVITVGLVNSGIMKLTQAVGIIYGANIGTTITAQIMSFKLTDLGIPVLVIGLIVKLLFKRRTVKNMGTALIGFGLMFIGINILSLSVPYIKGSPLVYNILQKYGSNHIICLVAGIIATMLVHSSSATVGITIILFNSGLLSFESSLALILGDNIGTCITAQIASIGTSIHARRTAWSHTLYNVIGVLIALILLQPFANITKQITFILGQDRSRFIANAHTFFNLSSAVIFLPFTKHYVRFIEWILPEK